jgi:hypothetical protein
MEDKFDGLKLNHIARQSNKATDELEKLASGWAPVPAGVFASDLYKPMVTYQGSVQDGSEPPKLASGAGPTLAPLILRLCKSMRAQTQGPTPYQTRESRTLTA